MTTFLMAAFVLIVVVAAAAWARTDRIRIPDRGRYPRTSRLWS
ncbi:MAG: hypothetical protein ACRDWI_12780 [Jiangellaceae bacterium]